VDRLGHRPFERRHGVAVAARARAARSGMQTVGFGPIAVGAGTEEPSATRCARQGGDRTEVVWDVPVQVRDLADHVAQTGRDRVAVEQAGQADRVGDMLQLVGDLAEDLGRARLHAERKNRHENRAGKNSTPRRIPIVSELHTRLYPSVRPAGDPGIASARGPAMRAGCPLPDLAGVHALGIALAIEKLNRRRRPEVRGIFPRAQHPTSFLSGVNSNACADGLAGSTFIDQLLTSVLPLGRRVAIW